MIGVVHPGSSGCWLLPIPDPGSRIQGSKRHRVRNTVGMDVLRFSSFLLYCVQNLNCRNCKRLREFEEIEISRQRPCGWLWLAGRKNLNTFAWISSKNSASGFESSFQFDANSKRMPIFFWVQIHTKNWKVSKRFLPNVSRIYSTVQMLILQNNAISNTAWKFKKYVEVRKISLPASWLLPV